MTGITLSHSASTSLAAASSAVAESASSAISRIKDGFLSCVRQVSNSMITLRNAISRGVERLAEIVRSARAPGAENSPPLTRKEDIQSVSLATTIAVCQAVEQRMQNDPANLDGMFRVSPELKPHQVNKYLDLPCDQLVKAIEHNMLNCAEMSDVLKKWTAGIMEGRQFTDAERQKMESDKLGHTTNDILTSKFQPGNASEVDDYNKLLCCLSVMRTYQKICDENDGVQGKNYDRAVVDRILIPSLFVIPDYSTGDSAKDLELTMTALSAPTPAFQALLKYSPPALLPTAVPAAGLPLDNTGKQTNQ